MKIQWNSDTEPVPDEHGCINAHWDEELQTCRQFQGGPVGHIVSGSMFCLIGFGFLAVNFWRARRCALRGTQSFAETYLPERDVVVLHRFGRMICAMAGTGIVYEFCLATYNESPLSGAFPHWVLYACYGIMGPLSIGESKRLLPPDSVKFGLMVTSVLCYLLWHDHAQMKSDPADNKMHEYAARICMAQSLLLLVSICQPKNVMFHLVSFGSMFALNGLWMYTAALQAGFIHISPHLMTAYFACEVIFLIALLAGASAHIASLSSSSEQQQSGNNNNKAYLSIVHHDDDDESEGDLNATFFKGDGASSDNTSGTDDDEDNNLV